MSLTLDSLDTLDPSQTRRRWKLVAAAAAAAVAISAGAVVLRPGDQSSASAAVSTAASALAEVTSLRATMHVEDHSEAGTDVTDVTMEMSGDDWQGTQETRLFDGSHESYRTVRIDGVEYETHVVDGEEQPPTSRPVTPNYELAPFGEASSAVVHAALKGSDVEEIGSEDVRGVEATHYRINLAEPGQSALADLPRSQRNWFELLFDADHLTGDVTLDIWTADDMIRRLAVSSPNTTSTTDYFDFNADITITPPPAP